jgi:8-oxo-dGTP diphosphatase
MRMIPVPEPTIDLAPLTAVYTERSKDGGGRRQGERSVKVVVGAAIVADGRVLACARANPPEVAGKWEFPGGKVEPGETEVAALVRECVEELAVRVEVGERVGPDVSMAHGRAVLKVYRARLVGADRPQALEHAGLCWLAADELDSVTWLPADVPIVAALRPLLAAERPADG